jgi:coenzyme PQQ synthesis protein D (PqqD)
MAAVFQRNVQIEMSPVGDEIILFDPKATRFLLLNRTSSFLWQQLEKPKTVEELTADVCRSFGGAVSSQVLGDVERALQEMQALELVNQ